MQNPNNPIVTYEDYSNIIGVPKDHRDKPETINRINKWLVQATDQIDSMISTPDEFNKLYKYYDRLKNNKREDQVRKYKLKKAICSWVETFILNGKIWTDGVPATNSNIDIDIASSSENSNIEMKRKDIIQDLVALGLYQTTNFGRSRRNADGVDDEKLAEIMITTRSELNDNYLNLTPQQPLRAPLNLGANDMIDTSNITAYLKGGRPFFKHYTLYDCLIDFTQNTVTNTNNLTAGQTEKILDPLDGIYKFINQFPPDYWGGPTMEKMYNAIYASGIPWSPLIQYKINYICRHVTANNKLKWYKAKRDNIGKNPEFSPDDWEELEIEHIDIQVIIDQLKPYIDQEMNNQIDGALEQRKHNFIQEEAQQIFSFNDEADFDLYKQATGTTDADWEDVADPIPPAQPLPNTLAYTDQANIFSAANTFEQTAVFDFGLRTNNALLLGNNAGISPNPQGMSIFSGDRIKVEGLRGAEFTPTNPADIATKKYVDDKVGQNNLGIQIYEEETNVQQGNNGENYVEINFNWNGQKIISINAIANNGNPALIVKDIGVSAFTWTNFYNNNKLRFGLGNGGLAVGLKVKARIFYI